MAEILSHGRAEPPMARIEAHAMQSKNNEGNPKRSPSSYDIREVLFANVFMVTSLRVRLGVSLR